MKWRFGCIHSCCISRKLPKSVSSQKHSPADRRPCKCQERFVTETLSCGSSTLQVLGLQVRRSGRTHKKSSPRRADHPLLPRGSDHASASHNLRPPLKPRPACTLHRPTHPPDPWPAVAQNPDTTRHRCTRRPKGGPHRDSAHEADNKTA